MQISPIFTFQPDAQGESTDKTHSKWLVVTLAQGCNKLGPGPRPPRTTPFFFWPGQNLVVMEKEAKLRYLGPAVKCHVSNESERIVRVKVNEMTGAPLTR